MIPIHPFTMTTARLEGLLAYAFGETDDGSAPALMRTFLEFLSLLKRVKPIQAHLDLIWECPWVRTQGRRVDWHSCRVKVYGETAYLFFKSQHSFAVDLKKKKFVGLHLFGQDHRKDAGYEMAEWLLSTLIGELKSLLANPQNYNRAIARRLPSRYRLGKVRRRRVWEHQRGKRFIRDELTRREIKEFLRVVQAYDRNASMKQMTRDRFLKICSIAYDAVFPQDEVSSLTQRYRLHADGRDDGLLKLPGQDSAAFEQWIRSGPKGGHPWEIIRGGNETHISLQPHYEDGKWTLYLDGHSTVCAARTVKISIALYRLRVPFELIEKEYMAELVQGKDWIGIVPEDVPPLYCHDLFEPYGEKIETFMNLGDFEKEPTFREEIHWYPVRPVFIHP